MISVCSSEELPINDQAREQFERLLPALQQQISFRYRHLTGELQEELSAEALALTFQAYVRLVQQGKVKKAAATPLAKYACQQVAEGRRCGTSLNIKDMTSHYCQLRNSIRGHSIHRHDPQTDRWQELVVEDRHAGPADVAATRIDFRDWLTTLTQRQREVAGCLAAGESTSVVARQLGLSSGRISQLRRELQTAWQSFQGLPLPEAA
ncbi:MAG: hypothetical protein N2C12_14440 [Planctomycetales bacterium]